MRTLILRKTGRVLLVAVVVSTLVACKGNKHEAAASQVAVSVNGDEITIHQVNDLMMRVPALRQAPPADSKREAVRSLIDQQLAIQQALAKKLDTSPDVVTALENAKREILFRAYVASVAADQPKPTPDEVKKYFTDHPQLFAARKVYQLELLDVLAGTYQDKVRAIASASKSMTEIAAALKQASIPFSADAGVRSSEQIPIAILPGVAELKDGQIGTFDNGNQTIIVHVLVSRSEPMNEDRATPLIQQFLINQRGTAAVEKKLQELRATAKLDFKGEFAQGSSSAPASTAAGTPPGPGGSVKPEPQPESKSAAAPVAVPGVDSAAINRGVSGLK